MNRKNIFSGLANGYKWVYKWGMFVEGLAEMGTRVSQRLEGVRIGVDQFLHDKRGSERLNLVSWSSRKVLLASGLGGFLLGVSSVEVSVAMINSFASQNLPPI